MSAALCGALPHMLSNQNVVMVASAKPATPPPSYLLQENFEAAPGYDTAWSEITVTGTLNEDMSTAGLSLQGSQCLRVEMAAQSGRAECTPFTSSGEVWLYFLFRPEVAASSTIMTIQDASVLNLRMRFTSTGALQLVGVGSLTAPAPLPLNQTYHVWMHYKKGTGADAVGSLAWSTDGIRPDSGANFLGGTTGTFTNNADRLAVAQVTSFTGTWNIDKIRVSSSEIGNNPP